MNIIFTNRVHKLHIIVFALIAVVLVAYMLIPRIPLPDQIVLAKVNRIINNIKHDSPMDSRTKRRVEKLFDFCVRCKDYMSISDLDEHTVKDAGIAPSYLRYPYPVVDIAVASTLIDCFGVKCIPYFVKQLHNSDSRIRLKSLIMINHIIRQREPRNKSKERWYAPIFVLALSDKSPDIRVRAIYDLGAMGGPMSKKYIIRTMNRDPNMRVRLSAARIARRYNVNIPLYLKVLLGRSRQ